MSVSPASVSVSATQGQAAPTANVLVSFNGLTTGQVYLTGQYTKDGIENVAEANGNGSITLTIQFTSPSNLSAGVHNDTLVLIGCYDQACTEQVSNSPQTVSVEYAVAAGLQLGSLDPASAAAGGAPFTLTASGTGFTPNSALLWNGQQQNTHFISSTEVSAQISAADIASAGTAAVTIQDPADGSSNALTFTIGPPQLTLSSISPTSVSAGSAAFTLTAFGADFTSSSEILWNGIALPTTLVSANELQAAVTAADVASPTSVSVTVQDTTSSVGTTPAQTLTVTPASVDAVSYQINPAHSGSIHFASISLPTGALWSVDVGGAPSYAIIAGGNVYLTVSLGVHSSEVIALSQATGAIVWGPLLQGSISNAAYDNGKLFVLSSPSLDAPIVAAYDAQSGTQLWSTVLAGQNSFTTGLTASNGFVYASGAGNGSSLYAVDESNGAIAWRQDVGNGESQLPAVTPDGVYMSYPCGTYDLNPVTGNPIWQQTVACDFGAGVTAVVANQLVFSPNGNIGFGYSGGIYSAATGASQGSYSADSPPAFGPEAGYFMQGGTLKALALATNAAQWSFAGDGQLKGAAIAVGPYVFIGSGSGNLYGLDASSGQQVWEVTLPSGVETPTYTGQLTGLSAGDGLLVVPAGTKVSAYLLSSNP